MNKTSFTVYDVLSWVKPGDLDLVDICLASPNDYDIDSTEDSGYEVFQEMSFIS